MRRRIVFVIVLVLGAVAPQLAQASDLILRPQPGVTANTIAARYGFMIVSTVPSQNIALVRTATDIPQTTIDSILANDKDVLNLEFSRTLHASPVPGGPALTQSIAAILESYETTFLNYYGGSVWDSYVGQSAA